ncbi:3-dehydroquinate dehydratase-1 [Lachnospiraceae bacterium PFB1-21]
MQYIEVRELELGRGPAKICVPVVGKKKEEILATLEKCVAAEADLVELRIDHFENVRHIEDVLELLGEAREILGETPLIFTYRTIEEGGKGDMSVEEYCTLYQEILESKTVDLVDIEAFGMSGAVSQIMRSAREHAVMTILSNHNFRKTPKQEYIIERLGIMHHLGADICKVAYMPLEKGDVDRLKKAVIEADKRMKNAPLVAIAMGDLGLESRIYPERFASCMTFASIGEESAPGQISIEEMKALMIDK